MNRGLPRRSGLAGRRRGSWVSGRRLECGSAKRSASANISARSARLRRQEIPQAARRPESRRAASRRSRDAQVSDQVTITAGIRAVLHVRGCSRRCSWRKRPRRKPPSSSVGVSQVPQPRCAATPRRSRSAAPEFFFGSHGRRLRRGRDAGNVDNHTARGFDEACTRPRRRPDAQGQIH